MVTAHAVMTTITTDHAVTAITTLVVILIRRVVSVSKKLSHAVGVEVVLPSITTIGRIPRALTK